MKTTNIKTFADCKTADEAKEAFLELEELYREYPNTYEQEYQKFLGDAEQHYDTLNRTGVNILALEKLAGEF